MGQERGSNLVRGGVLNHHATAHEVNALAGEIAPRAHVEIDGANIHLFQHPNIEIDQVALPANFVEVFADRHAEPSGVDG